MKYYKGFKHDMTCQGFQFKEGETYVEDRAELCKAGFHACENPLDVLIYYPPCDEYGNLNKYHEVELEDICEERDGEDTKVCAKKIKIGVELNLSELAKAHIEYIKNNLCENESAVNSGDRSVSVNVGDYSSAVNSGFRSVSINSGNRSVSVNDGDCSIAVNSGLWASAVNNGLNGIAVSWCKGGKAKGAKGCYLVLSEWGERIGNGHHLLGAKMVFVDGEKIKEDTFYKLVKGRVKEDK